MTAESRAAIAASKTALADGLRRSRPDVTPNGIGYVNEASENLLEDVRMEDFEEDLRQGAGSELKGKFLAAHSSSALAVNTFAPFKRDLPSLKLVGAGEFQCLRFERRCPSGLRGTPPHLDAVAVGAERVIGIESKCLETLSPHVAKFSTVYETNIVDARRQSRWFTAMRTLVAGPNEPLWLDAAQLIKHAFGLAHTFPDRQVTLLYLYWEPSNADEIPIFREHQKQVDAFAKSVVGDALEFVAMPYPELWSVWETQPGPAWLSKHVSWLWERYGVATRVAAARVALCRSCADWAFERWRGWCDDNSRRREPPPVPNVPELVGGTCPRCAGRTGLSPSDVFYSSYHSRYNTGLPDYFHLTVISADDQDRRGRLARSGSPYLSRRVGRVSLDSLAGAVKLSEEWDAEVPHRHRER